MLKTCLSDIKTRHFHGQVKSIKIIVFSKCSPVLQQFMAGINEKTTFMHLNYCRKKCNVHI